MESDFFSASPNTITRYKIPGYLRLSWLSIILLCRLKPHGKLHHPSALLCTTPILLRLPPSLVSPRKLTSVAFGPLPPFSNEVMSPQRPMIRLRSSRRNFRTISGGKERSLGEEVSNGNSWGMRPAQRKRNLRSPHRQLRLYLHPPR